MSSIAQLIKLQEIDSQLVELEEILGDLPLKVQELQSQEEKLVEEIETGKVRIKEIQLDLNKTEHRVAEETEKIDKLKDQLFKVSTNRQYDALMSEIDHMKAQLDKDETTDLELMEEKEKLDNQVKSQEANLGLLTKDLSTRRNKLEQMIEESAEQKTQFEAQRSELADTFDKDIIKRYNTVRIARRGEAVVAIQGRSCGGCGAMVPPQKLAEIKFKTNLLTCDECSRFLYFED